MCNNYESVVWRFAWPEFCRSGICGQVHAAGLWQGSLSQKSIGWYYKCRECLQQVQFIVEKAKTTTLLPLPTAVIHSSCNWTAKNARVRVYVHTRICCLNVNTQIFIILQIKSLLLKLPWSFNITIHAQVLNKWPLGKMFCCFLPMRCACHLKCISLDPQRPWVIFCFPMVSQIWPIFRCI